jgi:hypothetical protein
VTLLTLERARKPRLDLSVMEPNAERDQAVRRELDTILSSHGFVQSKRLTEFLRFVVERHLDGKDDEIKETSRFSLAKRIMTRSRTPSPGPKRDGFGRNSSNITQAKAEIIRSLSNCRRVDTYPYFV